MAKMEEKFVEKMISRVNKKDWWHCPPSNPDAYRKRGKFFASSFQEAEFWGRPLDEPQHVIVSNPLISDEDSIEIELFGHSMPAPGAGFVNVLEWRWNLDKRMKKVAQAKGYDAIVLLTPKAFTAFRQQGKIPLKRATYFCGVQMPSRPKRLVPRRRDEIRGSVGSKRHRGLANARPSLPA
jgi:hypothetical protein